MLLCPTDTHDLLSMFGVSSISSEKDTVARFFAHDLKYLTTIFI